MIAVGRTIAGAALAAIGGVAVDLYVKHVLSPAYPAVRAFRGKPLYVVLLIVAVGLLALSDLFPSRRAGAPSAPR